MRSLLGISALALFVIATDGSAQAAITTFLGVDEGLGLQQGVFVRLPAHPNADAARDAFLANLTGVGTESFESFAGGTAGPLGVDFGVAGTATLQGGGNIEFCRC